RRIEIHPGKIALVIIVGRKRGGPACKKLLQCGVWREVCSFAKKFRELIEVGLVFLTVGHNREFSVGTAAYDCEESFGLLFLRRRKSLYPAFEFFLRHVFRIEIGARQFA